MICPCLKDLPDPPRGKIGWPWTEETPPVSIQCWQGVEWPKVTLVTPSFNQGKYLEETIRSALLQGYPNLEYFIMDGGSTDETVNIIRRYERWLAGWVSEPDGGQSQAINKGLACGTGEFFNWHNADDVLTKGSLAVTARALADHAQASAVTGYIITIDDKSQIISVNDGNPSINGENGFFYNQTKCFSALKTGCQPGGLMRRNLVVEVGGVDETIHYCMDVDLLLRLMVAGPAYHVHYPVVMFRIHSESKTIAMKGSRAIERLLIAQKLFSQKNLSSEISEIRHLAFATAHLSASSYFYDWRVYGMAFYHFFMRWMHISIHHIKKINAYQERKSM